MHKGVRLAPLVAHAVYLAADQIIIVIHPLVLLSVHSHRARASVVLQEAPYIALDIVVVISSVHQRGALLAGSNGRVGDSVAQGRGIEMNRGRWKKVFICPASSLFSAAVASHSCTVGILFGE